MAHPIDDPSVETEGLRAELASMREQVDGLLAAQELLTAAKVEAEAVALAETGTAATLLAENATLAGRVHAIEAERKTERRESALAMAIQTGQIVPAERQRFAALYDADVALFADFMGERVKNPAVKLGAVGHGLTPAFENDEDAAKSRSQKIADEARRLSDAEGSGTSGYMKHATRLMAEGIN